MNQHQQKQTQELVSNEDSDRMKVEIAALIETVVLQNPTMEGRLNAQAVWNYLNLPDASFGWVDGWKGNMPWRVKVQAVLAHLIEGIQPGFGHLLFLGNSLYQTAEYARTKMLQDPALTGASVSFSLLSQDKRKAFILEDGDLALECRLVGNMNGYGVEWEGIGIIDKDEKNKKDKKGNKMGMFASKKNLVNTLQTRAMHNLIKYNYRTSIPVAPSHEEVLEIQQQDQEQMAQLNFMSESSDEIDRKATRAKVADEQRHESIGSQLAIANDLIEQAERAGHYETLKEAFKIECNPFVYVQKLKLDELVAFCNEVSGFLAANGDAEPSKETEPPFPPDAKLAKKKTSKKKTAAKKKTAKAPEIIDDRDAKVVAVKDVKSVEVSFLPEENEAPAIDLLGELRERPAAAQSEYDVIEKFSKHKKVLEYPGLVKRIEVLQTKYLLAGDKQTIIDAVTKAVTQKDFESLDNFIELREDL